MIYILMEEYKVINKDNVNWSEFLGHIPKNYIIFFDDEKAYLDFIKCKPSFLVDYTSLKYEKDKNLWSLYKNKTCVVKYSHYYLNIKTINIDRIKGDIYKKFKIYKWECLN